MKRIIVILLICCCQAFSVWSAGLNRTGGLGPKAGAMSGAYTAIADDISVFYYNPAGLVNFTELYAELGTELIVPRFSYKRNGRKIRSADVYHPLPLGGYIRPLTDDLVFGLGIYSPYGLGTSFEANRFQKWKDTETMLGVVNLSQAIAWRVNDKLSLGLSLDIGYGQFVHRAPLEIFGRPSIIYADNKADGFGLGGSFGLLFQDTNWSFGLKATSPLKVFLEGRSELSVGPITFRDRLETEFTFPGRLSFGLAWSPNEKLTLAFDTKYTFYQPANKEMTLSFRDLPISKKEKLAWKNALGFHWGLSYQATDHLALRTGFGWLAEVIPNEIVSTLMADVAGWDISAGVEYRRGDFSLLASALWGFGDREVRTFVRREKYKADVFVFSLSGSYRF